MSKLQDFVRLVNKMRKAQKMAAKTKTRSALEQVKRLEESVDRELEEFGYEVKKVEQYKQAEMNTRPMTQEEATYLTE